MERIRRWFGTGQLYEQLGEEEDTQRRRRDDEVMGKANGRVSVFEYGVFLFLGCAMLWSWNMFMACATYFQRRFSENVFILNNFQSFILVVSTITNLSTMLYLTTKHTTNYSTRICASLIINMAVFTLLALSTVWFEVGAKPYLVFVLLCVFASSLSTGMSQNGVFAHVNRYGGIYTQAIMTGQGIAGVLPAIAQIVSVVAIPQADNDLHSSPKSAFVYFATATFVSAVTLGLFLLLLSREPSQTEPLLSNPEESEDEAPSEQFKKGVSLWTMLKKLRYLSFALWYCFCVTMAFPVFTQAIVSVRDPADASRFFQPDVFIPWGFLLWNVGDLLGRIICGFEALTASNPKIILACSLARTLFIPAYFLCNIKGEGAVIDSDLFYWLLQLGFGVSNGWVGSNAMMVAPAYVGNDEKEASGGFMSTPQSYHYCFF
ncbi:hypothetical protein RUND412_005952 [Rhizina undulata]